MIKRPSGGSWIGLTETILFYALLLASRPEGIAAWLVFKVAAKWDAWKNIVQWPDRLPGHEKDEKNPLVIARYVGARNMIGSWIMGRFTLGTAINIIVALAGYVTYVNVKQYYIGP